MKANPIRRASKPPVMNIRVSLVGVLWEDGRSSVHEISRETARTLGLPDHGSEGSP